MDKQVLDVIAERVYEHLTTNLARGKLDDVGYRKVFCRNLVAFIAADLASRAAAVRDWRVAESEDPVTEGLTNA